MTRRSSLLPRWSLLVCLGLLALPPLAQADGRRGPRLPASTYRNRSQAAVKLSQRQQIRFQRTQNPAQSRFSVANQIRAKAYSLKAQAAEAKDPARRMELWNKAKKLEGKARQMSRGTTLNPNGPPKALPAPRNKPAAGQLSSGSKRVTSRDGGYNKYRLRRQKFLNIARSQMSKAKATGDVGLMRKAKLNLAQAAALKVKMWRVQARQLMAKAARLSQKNPERAAQYNAKANKLYGMATKVKGAVRRYLSTIPNKKEVAAFKRANADALADGQGGQRGQQVRGQQVRPPTDKAVAAVVRQNDNVMRWANKADDYYQKAVALKDKDPNKANELARKGQHYEYKANRMMGAIQRKLQRNPGLEDQVVKALQQREGVPGQGTSSGQVRPPTDRAVKAVVRQNDNVMRWANKANEYYQQADALKSSDPGKAAQMERKGQHYEYKANRMAGAIQRKLDRNPGLEDQVVQALQQREGQGAAPSQPGVDQNVAPNAPAPATGRWGRAKQKVRGWVDGARNRVNRVASAVRSRLGRNRSVEQARDGENPLANPESRAASSSSRSRSSRSGSSADPEQKMSAKQLRKVVKAHTARGDYDAAAAALKKLEGKKGLRARYHRWKARRYLNKKAYKAGVKALKEGNLITGEKAYDALKSTGALKKRRWLTLNPMNFGRKRATILERSALKGASRAARGGRWLRRWKHDRDNPELAANLLKFVKTKRADRGKTRLTLRYRWVRRTARKRAWTDMNIRAKDGNMNAFRAAKALVEAYAEERGKPLSKRQEKKLAKMETKAQKRSVVRALDDAIMLLNGSMGHVAPQEAHERLIYAQDVGKKLAAKGITIRTGLFRRTIEHKVHQVEKLFDKMQNPAYQPKLGLFKRFLQAWLKQPYRRQRPQPAPLDTVWIQEQQQAHQAQMGKSVNKVLEKNDRVFQWANQAEQLYKQAEQLQKSDPGKANQLTAQAKHLEYKAQRLMGAIQRKLAANPHLEQQVIQALQGQGGGYEVAEAPKSDMVMPNEGGGKPTLNQVRTNGAME